MIVLGVLFVILPVCHSSLYRAKRDDYGQCEERFCFATLPRENATLDEARELCRNYTKPNASLLDNTIYKQLLEFQNYINTSRDPGDTLYLLDWKKDTEEKFPSCWTSTQTTLVPCNTGKIVCVWWKNGSHTFRIMSYSSTSPHLPSEATSPESSGPEPSSPDSSTLASSRDKGDTATLVTLAVIAGVIFVVLIVSIVGVIIIFRKLNKRSEYCRPMREFDVNVTSTPNCYVSLDTTVTCEEGSKDIEGFYGVVQQTSTTDEYANMIDPTAADNGACKPSPGLIYADLEFLNVKPEEPETTETNNTAT